MREIRVAFLLETLIPGVQRGCANTAHGVLALQSSLNPWTVLVSGSYDIIELHFVIKFLIIFKQSASQPTKQSLFCNKVVPKNDRCSFTRY